MSHGAPSTEGVEINLIPMIDIVIQLITFFLMLVNFDQTNTDERVRLPIADLAAPTDENIEEPLVLNINRYGQISMLGELHDVESPVLRQQLQREAHAAVLNMQAHGRDVESAGGKPELWTTVVVRADKDVDYGKILAIMRMCQEIGFQKYSLRASPSPESM